MPNVFVVVLNGVPQGLHTSLEKAQKSVEAFAGDWHVIRQPSHVREWFAYYKLDQEWGAYHIYEMKVR
jgi:hypothetical protein